MHIGVITFKRISLLICMNSGQYVYFNINSLKTSVLINMNSEKYIELSCKNSLKMSVLVDMNSEKY